jgi:hypothetical protein
MRMNLASFSVINVVLTTITMPRTPIYHTAKERREANCAKSLRSYYKYVVVNVSFPH